MTLLCRIIFYYLIDETHWAVLFIPSIVTDNVTFVVTLLIIRIDNSYKTKWNLPLQRRCGHKTAEVCIECY